MVIPLLRDHAIMLARNLLYTAATRGRQLVVLVAEPRALEMALSDARIRRRYAIADNAFWRTAGSWWARLPNL